MDDWRDRLGKYWVPFIVLGGLAAWFTMLWLMFGGVL